MIGIIRWTRFASSFCFFVFLITSAIYYRTSIYLLLQAKGQLLLLLQTQSIQSFEKAHTLSVKEMENLTLVKEIKKYSVDRLGYKATNNYTRIYDQKGKSILWVITASEPYELKAYKWNFPVVGEVSYKGFFNKERALKEYNHLTALGYDVDLRSVSAWSTLGWFNDPFLSSMLTRSKGSLCNLVFHELFHASYYAPNSVDFNENIASFIAHKATLRFLENDSLALKEYLANYKDNSTFNKYMLRQIDKLNQLYSGIQNQPNKYELKLKAIFNISDSIRFLPLVSKEPYILRAKDLMKFKNAYFVDFVQYDSMQDSLEVVFNKIYKGNIEKLVQDLTLD
jgi:predicted aminopeptidase